MDFWTRLKERIKANYTSQEWVANKIQVSFSTFRKWFTRKTYPDARESVEIARLLNTTVEYLVTGEGPYELDEEERRFMENYRRLSDHDRENISLAVQCWVERDGQGPP
jgi:transcriptional regulator with XRE-family HTH domain